MRIDYIDKLKGFAIILVVMGHVIEKSLMINEQPINIFYTSFHMPLFMFLSGIFALKSFILCNYSECVLFIKNKARRIIVPFILVGGLLSYQMYGDCYSIYVGLRNQSFWFLPTLFYCMITEMIVFVSFKKNVSLRFDKWYIDIVSHITIFFLLSAIYLLWNPPVPYYLHFVKQYPFFVFGVFFTRYKLLSILNKELLYAGSFVLYFLFLYVQYNNTLPFGPAAFFAIIILLNLFVKYASRIPCYFSEIGKRSLQIYVFHWFLLPTLIPVGHKIDQMGGAILKF